MLLAACERNGTAGMRWRSEQRGRRSGHREATPSVADSGFRVFLQHGPGEFGVLGGPARGLCIWDRGRRLF